MAFKVALEGNPTSGKTELSPLIEAELNVRGISTLDAKRHDLESGFLGRVRRRFVQEEIETRKDFALSVAYHAANYIGAMLLAKRLEDEYDVVLMQRIPWSYLHIVESVRNGWNDGVPQSGLLYRVTQAWTSMAKPDAIIYLDCPRETLRERFAHRSNRNGSTGSDWVHRLLIEQDNSRFVEFLRNYIGENNFYVVDSSYFPAAVANIARLIRQEVAARKPVMVHEAEKNIAQRI